MEEFKNLLPKKLSYEFGGNTVEVAPLSIKQTIELSRILSKQITEVSKNIVTNKLKDMSFTELLDEALLAEENIISLLVIITGKDKKFFTANFKTSTDLISALKLIREVFIKEGIGEVFTEKLQIAQIIQKIYLGR